MTKGTRSGIFFEDLLTHIMSGINTPKFQVERAIGPILGFFIEKVMSSLLNDEIIIVSAEFPLKKSNDNQSTNIDWLMYSPSKNKLIFVELKTTDSFRDTQKDVYLGIQDRISAETASFLQSDLSDISMKSRESGKYKSIIEILKKKSIDFSSIKTCKIVYILPNVVKSQIKEEDKQRIEFFSFKELRIDTSIKADYLDEWKILHKHLCELDEVTRKSRNKKS